MKPDLFLLDEPTMNLDPFNAALIETIINELGGKSKSTILLVTHNVSQAHRLADRSLVIFSGKCIEVIEGENLLESAKAPRTRSYIQGTFSY